MLYNSGSALINTINTHVHARSHFYKAFKKNSIHLLVIYFYNVSQTLILSMTNLCLIMHYINKIKSYLSFKAKDCPEI